MCKIIFNAEGTVSIQSNMWSQFEPSITAGANGEYSNAAARHTFKQEKGRQESNTQRHGLINHK